MKLRVKIGTHSSNVVDLHGDYFNRRKGSSRPPKLKELPAVGTRVSWQEHENGEWHTGIVDGIDESLDLYRIARL